MKFNLTLIRIFGASLFLLIAAARLTVVLPFYISLVVALPAAFCILDYEFVLRILRRNVINIQDEFNNTLTFRIFKGDLFLAALVSFIGSAVLTLVLVFGTGYGIRNIVLPVAVNHITFRTGAAIELEGIEVNPWIIAKSAAALATKNPIQILFPLSGANSDLNKLRPDLRIDRLAVKQDGKVIILNKLIYYQQGALEFELTNPLGVLMQFYLKSNSTTSAEWSADFKKDSAEWFSGNGQITNNVKEKQTIISGEKLKVYLRAFGLASDDWFLVRGQAQLGPLKAIISGKIFDQNGRSAGILEIEAANARTRPLSYDYNRTNIIHSNVTANLPLQINNTSHRYSFLYMSKKSDFEYKLIIDNGIAILKARGKLKETGIAEIKLILKNSKIESADLTVNSRAGKFFKKASGVLTPENGIWIYNTKTNLSLYDLFY